MIAIRAIAAMTWRAEALAELFDNFFVGPYALNAPASAALYYRIATKCQAFADEML